MPEVSVVVPARDAAGSLPRLLDALLAQAQRPAAVIVVDDASTDGTAEVARTHPLAPQVLTGSGAGSYAARNVGLSAVTTECVAFTDADCEPTPQWLSAGLEDVAPGVLVGGAVQQRRRPGAGRWERYDRAVYLDQAELVAQGFAATANLFARVDDLRSLGGFDATLRSSGDKELGQRALRAGMRVVLAEGAVVVHEPRTDLRGTWALLRRLGSGWRALGEVPWWQEPGLRVPLGRAVELVAADGDPLRRRQLAPVHAVALAARWRGRLLG
ncbi:MAG: Dolichyl-phosphate mannose synthase related protein [Frankiales bacterium]|nr:Dolichyl-phosphate mannose synthase related protein [Frankiales bacterium]